MKNLIHSISQYSRKLFEACLPSLCLLCHLPSKQSLICPFCHDAILTERPCCLHCGCGLTSTQSFCGECLKHHFDFTQLHAIASYQSPFPELIKQLKYNNQLLYADLLGQLLADSIKQRYSQQQLQEIDYLIPVPLHIKKHRKRGFNQALLISKALTKYIPITITENVIIRNKFTEAQEGLSRAQRTKNLKHAFSLTKKAETSLQGKYVVLMVAPVVTTSSINKICLPIY